MKDKFKIGDRVMLNSGMGLGEVASEMFEIRGQPQYAVRLAGGFWSENKECYVSHLVVHQDGLKKILGGI